MASPSDLPSVSGLDALIRPDRLLLDMVNVLPVEGAVHGWRVIRTLTLWCSAGPDGSAGLVDDDGLEQLEVRILEARYDDSLRLPLAVIVGSLRVVGTVAGAENRLAYACMCAAEWASGQHAPRVMLGFALVAAAAAGTDRYRLVAELARLGVELAGLPVGDPEGQRPVLEARRRSVARHISLLGGDVRSR